MCETPTGRKSDGREILEAMPKKRGGGGEKGERGVVRPQIKRSGRGRAVNAEKRKKGAGPRRSGKTVTRRGGGKDSAKMESTTKGGGRLGP